MTKPTIKILDLSTNEEIVREMNAEEFAQWQAGKIEAENAKAVEAAKTHERTALLERLGITEDEAQLLLGGN